MQRRAKCCDWEVFSSNYGVMLNDATGGVAIISNLVGIPEAGRERMLAWATASFDAMGPMKARTEAAIPLMLEMLNYGRTEAVPRLGPDGV